MKFFSFQNEVLKLRAFLKIDSIGVQGGIMIFLSFVYLITIKGYFYEQR